MIDDDDAREMAAMFIAAMGGMTGDDARLAARATLAEHDVTAAIVDDVLELRIDGGIFASMPLEDIRRATAGEPPPA